MTKNKRPRIYYDVGHVRGWHSMDHFSKENPPPEQRPELGGHDQLIAIVDTERYITAIDVSHQEDWSRLTNEMKTGYWQSIKLRRCDGYRGSERETRRYKPGKKKYLPKI